MSVIEQAAPKTGNTISLVEHAPAGVSGRCLSCGQPHVGAVVMFSASKVVLCAKYCANRVAEALGCVSAEESVKLREEAKRNAGELTRLTGELARVSVDRARVDAAQQMATHVTAIAALCIEIENPRLATEEVA